MSKKGDCYDNAAMESWNHSFKVEAIHGERFLTRSDPKYQVFDYIVITIKLKWKVGIITLKSKRFMVNDF